MSINNSPQITVVLGSGRSGTSVITKALQNLGCYLGDNLTPPNDMNPKGFFEDNRIVYEVNEKVLTHLKTTWSDILPFDATSMDPTLGKIQEHAKDILQEKFKHSSWCAFKDPRTSRLLPFWQSLFEKTNIQDNYVIALRNPLSSVASFQLYDNIHYTQGFLLWLASVIPAVTNILNKATLIVSYEELINNPSKQLGRMKNFYSHLSISNEADMINYSENFLDRSLFRNQFSYDDFKSCKENLPLCIKIYDLLNLVALDKLSLQDKNFKEQWQELCSQYNIFIENFHPSYLAFTEMAKGQQITTKNEQIFAQNQQIAEQKQLITAQNQKIMEQQQAIQAILSSHSWHLTKPLRKISAYFKKDKN